MIYIGFDTLTNKYKVIKSEKNVALICSEYNFTGELYRIIDDDLMQILNTKTFEFVEFRALFANLELFKVCKKYLNQKLKYKYLYHHTINKENINKILKQGIRKNIGEVYQDCLISYLDDFKFEYNFSLPEKYYDNINSNHLVKGIFLCSDTNYNLTDEDFVIIIDTKYL